MYADEPGGPSEMHSKLAKVIEMMRRGPATMTNEERIEASIMLREVAAFLGGWQWAKYGRARTEE